MEHNRRNIPASISENFTFTFNSNKIYKLKILR